MQFNLTRSFNRMLSVARKEIRQLMRDVLTMGFVVGVPAVQLLLFGYAINQDVRHIKTAVVDHSNSFISRQLVEQLQATQTFDIDMRLDNDREARELLKKGKIQVVVVVPPDYTRSYYRGRGAEISVLVDATDPVLARAVKASATGLMDKHNRRLQRFDIGSEGSAGAGNRPPAGRRGRQRVPAPPAGFTHCNSAIRDREIPAISHCATTTNDIV